MKTANIILLGAGGVGQAFLRQIIAGRDLHRQRNQSHLNVVAIADSKSALWQPEGLDDTAIKQAIDRKRNRQPVSEPSDEANGLALLQKAEKAGLDNVIVVDVTAEDGMEPVMDKALALGYGLALANKKIFAGPYNTAKKYFNHSHIRCESTVGGGQPVIATLRYLLDTNDPIHRIEGQLSGTLGFVCSRLDEGFPFSLAIGEAKGRGFTEPDPREDLGGKDVMRKVMILGRMAGWPLEEADIEAESLYSPALAHLSVPEFMAAAISLNPSMQDRVQQAASEGNVLRYIAELEDGKGRVGLKPMPKDSPLANLKYISFQTGRYNDEPLRIGGKGAGVEMTAAGVIGDVLSLIREVF